MTDRELLELAAKAAGFETIEYHAWAGMDIRHGFDSAIWNGEDYWNPLSDDGDALRLAVKLKLTLQQNFYGVFCYDNPDFADKRQKMIEVYESIQDDPCAATRRAIVLVAAKIGKAMT